MAAPEGILVVDKPGGWTSHDVVARCRRIAATRKVGHAGTLDPMATGVLVLGIGRATRLLGHLAASTKAYDATVRLGMSTVTDDAEGEVVSTADASGLTEAEIESALVGLRGDVMQTPSAISAVKVDGKRAYARVRAGEAVQIAPRPVRIDDLTVLRARREGAVLDLDIRVECSAGTYVRAIARDLGRVLGVGGHIRGLRRTRSGAYALDHAHSLDDLARVEPDDLPVLGLDEVARSSFALYAVPADLVSSVRNGRPLATELGTTGAPVAVVSPDGEFLALYEQHGPLAKPVAVLAPA